LESFDVEVREANKSSHFKCIKFIAGKKEVYPVPLQQGRYIDHKYVVGARRRFRLTPADGVSDEEFYGR